MAEGKNPIPLLIMTSKETIDEERFKFLRSVLYDRVYRCASIE